MATSISRLIGELSEYCMDDWEDLWGYVSTDNGRIPTSSSVVKPTQIAGGELEFDELDKSPRRRNSNKTGRGNRRVT